MKRAEELPLSGIASWFFSTTDQWPEVFAKGTLGQIWYEAEKYQAHRQTDDIVQFVDYLRVGLLKELYQANRKCERCPLHQYRLNGLAVLDDGNYLNDPFDTRNNLPIGAYKAKIMLVGEGPGQYEQRTGVPFISFQVLAGSRCVQACTRFEECYEGSSVPKRACDYISLYKETAAQYTKEYPDHDGESQHVGISCRIDEIVQKRVLTKAWYIHTAGNILDEALRKASLWREGWNPRQQLTPKDKLKAGMEPRTSDVYLCNAVRCRSAVPTTGNYKVDGLKDDSPSRANIETCNPWLQMQIHIIQPEVIGALGNPAIISVLGEKDPKVTQLRGKVIRGPHGIPVVPEVHPSYILRQMTDKPDQGRPVHNPTSTEEVNKMVESFSLMKKLASRELVPDWLQAKVPAAENIREAKFIPTFGETHEAGNTNPA
jgi:uracil-DNA glycosylase family 4